MKIIYPELQTAIAATSFDANFPAGNLINNEVPSKLWKAAAGVNAATLTATIGSGAAGIGIYNTNANSAVFTVKNNAGATVKTQTITLASTRTYNRAWLEYTRLDEVHTVEIALTATAGVTVYAGKVGAGTVVAFPNPQYGMGEGRNFHGVILEMNGGTNRIVDGNINREFNLSFVGRRSTYFDDFCDIYDANGPHPLCMLLVENDVDARWTIYGHMLQPYTSGHGHIARTSWSVPITEAI